MLEAHYIPSWNGDWRLEPHAEDPERKTTLRIAKPTAGERRQLREMQKAFIDRGWLGDADKAFPEAKSIWTRRVTINAPLSDVGPVVIPIAKPGKNVLTAVRFRDGHVEVVEAAEMKAEPLPEKKRASKSEATEKPEEPSKPDKVAELAAKPDAKAAATVRRPTPCCPDCYEDAVKPATDVLLSFLDEEQHRTWQSDRYVIVRGEYTRHRYLIAHRHSPIAARNRRNTYDLDDGMIMHFHDWTVPPEEEVLAAMLILQHREPWLRNEATCLGGQQIIFKNPFGGGGDGVRDSVLTHRIGLSVLNALGMSQPSSGHLSTANAYPIVVSGAGMTVTPGDYGYEGYVDSGPSSN